MMANIMKVRRQEPVLVAPSKPTKYESKELSDIDDQEALRIQVPMIMCFRANDHLKEAGKLLLDPAKVIKEALAEALVYYYPFAGRLREGHNRKLIVDCNGEGVLFVEADADVALKEIESQILPPCPLLEELLFDVPGSSAIIGCPLLLLQVTRFTCGGYTLAIRFNHTMCDAQGFMELLNTMSELRGDQEPSIVPVWHRELLRARCTPAVTCTHQEYDEDNENSKDPYHQEECNMVHGSFYFGPKEIKAIRSHLPTHLQRSCTTYDLLCACIWRCRTLALQPHPEDTITLSYVVNVRRIMSLPSGFYGNAVAYPAVTTKARQFMFRENWLEKALELVKEAKARVNEEYVRSVMDFMVIKGKPRQKKFLTWIPTNLTRLGFENVNFGWGAPLYCGIPRGINVGSIFTRLKDGTRGEDVIVVPLRLPIEAMLRFQKELARVVEDAFHSLDVLQPVFVRSML